jgi:hypothetical protein
VQKIKTAFEKVISKKTTTASHHPSHMKIILDATKS